MVWRQALVMPFGPASILGVESFDTDAVAELLPGDDDLKKLRLSAPSTGRFLVMPMSWTAKETLFLSLNSSSES